MILKEQEKKIVYSDGETVEQEMLAIAKAYPEDSSQDYISHMSKYTVNNTFSSVRRNILNWYPFKKDADILEVGAGMGSITGLLCDVAKSVTSIEMSEARADVIRARYPYRKNLTIISEDINHWKTERKFDYIVFIGVLEYAAVFSDVDNPYEQFLRRVRDLLKSDGIVLFAIENRFGLKYWAGGSEDHLQKPYVGIEGYKDKKTPRTFSKAELKDLLNLVGLKYNRFYYVLPDYKFPEIICTDDYLPDYSTLEKLSFTYSKNSVLAFDEKDVYKEILANGVLDFFANSYLIEASLHSLEENYIAYVSARSEVQKPYRVFTLINNNRQVSKVAMHEEAQRHVLNINKYAKDLISKGVRVLEGKLVNGKYISAFFYGESAQDRFAALLRANDIEGIHELIELLRENLLKSSELSKKNTNIIDEAGLRSLMRQKEETVLSKGYIDMTFYNAFIDSEGLIFYDQEWCYEDVPLEFVLYYAIKSVYKRVNVETRISLNNILEKEKLLNFSVAFDKLEEYIWSKVFYRQNDLYGEDGYCNRYNSDNSLQALLQCNVQTQNQLEQTQNQLEQTQNQLEQTQNQLEQTQNQLEQTRAQLTQTQHHLKEEQDLREDLIVQCNNKEGHIQLLLQSERDLQNELNAMRNSRTWRVASFMHKPVVWLFPENSKRRLGAKMCVRLLRHPIRSFKMLSPRKIRHFFSFLKQEGPEFVAKRMDESMQGIAIQKMELDVSKILKDKSFEEYESLCFKYEHEPVVSIVIPVYNQFAYTYNCLQSILQNTGNNVTYEVIIANDCSTDDTIRMQEIVKNVQIVTNKENLRFLKNCNHAAEYARGKYILFLNNDTQVQENWLTPLVELIESSDNIGMVGSKLVYANGKLQEAGGIVWRDASAWNYGNGQDPENPEFNYVKEVDYISGAAIMIRASLWKEIGGFDELFAPAYYEDTDLAFEVRKHGYKVMYQPLSVVIHFEGITNGTDVAEGQKAYQAANEKKFYQKWKHVLTKENFENGENIFWAKDRTKDKKTLLMVDHYVPMYDKDAGSRCMFYYLNLFVNKGYDVKFIGDNFYKHEPYTTTLQQMGIEVLYGNYYYNNWKSWLRLNGKYFDYVFLSRPHISIKYIDLVREYTKAKIIYFGHDLHYLREMREYQLNGREQSLKDSKEWKKTELELMRKADVSYYLSKVELEEIAKVDSSVKVRRVPINIYTDIPDIDYQAENREDIIFVGGFGHPPNVDAVSWLGEEIMPKVWEKMPGITLHVIGSNPPREIKNLASEHLILHGFISDEELEEMYQNIKLAIVPLRYGAGIKGKIIEGMMRGVPMVTTSIGIEGIEGAEQIVKVSDEAGGLADFIVELYGNPDGLEEMAEREHQYIIDNYSEEEAVRILKEDFEF